MLPNVLKSAFVLLSSFWKLDVISWYWTSASFLSGLLGIYCKFHYMDALKSLVLLAWLGENEGRLTSWDFVFSCCTSMVMLCGARGHGLEVEDAQSTSVWHRAKCWYGGVVSCFSQPQHLGLRDVSAPERGEITQQQPQHPSTLSSRLNKNTAQHKGTVSSHTQTVAGSVLSPAQLL